MPLPEDFLKNLWLATKCPDTHQQFLAKKALFGDISTVHHCLTAFGSRREEIEESILTLCSCILDLFLHKSTVPTEAIQGDLSAIVEQAFAVLSDPNSVGRYFCESISLFLKTLHTRCPFDVTNFLELGFRLTGEEGNVAVNCGFSILTFCSLAIRRAKLVGSEGGLNFIRSWMEAVPKVFTVESVFNPKTACIVSTVMQEFSGNLKAWFHVCYTCEALFIPFNEVLKKIVEMGESGEVIEDDERRMACAAVIQALFSTLHATSSILMTECDKTILQFQKTPLFAEIYMSMLLAVPAAFKVFRSDRYRKIVESMLAFVDGNLVVAQELGIFEKPEVLKQLFFDVYTGAQLLDVNYEVFCENPVAFYQEAFLNEATGLRYLSCNMQKELCSMFPPEVCIGTLLQFPPSEGLLRLVSVVCKYVCRKSQKGQISEDALRMLAQLVDYSAEVPDFPGDPAILYTSKMFTMADQLFLRDKESIGKVCEMIIQQELLTKTEASGKILFTIGCKLVRQLLKLAWPVPDELLAHLFQRIQDCISVDILCIMEQSINEQRACLPPPADVMAFLFQELIRMAHTSQSDAALTEQKRTQHCYMCLRALYENGAPIDPFLTFWTEYFAIQDAPVVDILKCVMDLCQLKVPGIYRLMPLMLEQMHSYSIDDTEVEDIMRIFVHFFYSNVEQISTWDERNTLINPLWSMFQRIWNKQNLEPMIYLLGEVIVLILQEHWLQPEHAGIAAHLSAEMIGKYDPPTCPTLVLVAFDILISVFVFYHDECPGFDPLSLCPVMMDRCLLLFNSGGITRRQDFSMHLIFFLAIHAMHPENEQVNAALQFLQNWKEPDEDEANPNIHDVVSEFESLASPAFLSLLSTLESTAEEET